MSSSDMISISHGSCHPRPSSVHSLRLKTPYVAFAPRVVTSRDRICTRPPPRTTHAHPEPTFDALTFAPGNSGYGSRHHADIAPFSLWDGESKTFRLPSTHESEWVFGTFSAVSVDFSWPRIIIETATPPSPVPLTVACVAAVFIPVNSEYPRIVTNASYSDPRIADPIETQHHWPKWDRPTKEQFQIVWESLGLLMNVQALNFIPPIIVVELEHDDGRVYKKRSLPGKVAGRLTLYHHGLPSFWGTTQQARERFIRPSEIVQDTTNHLLPYGSTMCPGVRVESGSTSRQGAYLNTTLASSAGVLIRSVDEGQRMTVSNHGFSESDEVYHPSQAAGKYIGHITERFEHLDIALVDLFPSSMFTNNEYFQAQIPKRLLRSAEVSDNVWCSVDGMPSGLVYLRTDGIRMRKAQHPPGVVIPIAKFLNENIYEYIGPSGGQIREGICGAPIVVDDGDEDQDGGVVGFFHLGARDSWWALSPCLDDLIDRGWGLV